jgi:hypothetical protein
MKKGWIIALSILLIGIIGAFVWFNRLKNRTEREVFITNGRKIAVC